MSFTPLQKTVVAAIADELADMGFALGGGHALHLHTGHSRPSNDIDAYAVSQDPNTYASAARRLCEALRARGFTAEVAERFNQDWFRALDITDPVTGEVARVDLGMDYRLAPPVYIEDVGTVVSMADCLRGKVGALLDRRAERDFVDLDVVLRDGRWTFNDIMVYADMREPGITRKQVRAVLARATDGDPVEYAAIGYGSSKVAAMARRFASCGRCRVCGRELTSSRTVSAGVGRRCAERLR